MLGSKFLNQIKLQRKYLKENLKLNVRVIGISNSRTMVFNEKSLDLNSWETELANGEKADKKKFLERVNSLNLRNSIFVDNTASEEIASTYGSYLGNIFLW